MAVSIHIDESSGIAIATCSGVLGLDEALDAAARLWKTAGWSGRSAVWDFRAAKFAVSGSDVRTAASFIREHQPQPPPTSMAFVTDRDVDFGLSRMFEVFRGDEKTAVRVFRDYDEAVAWANELRPQNDEAVR